MSEPDNPWAPGGELADRSEVCRGDESLDHPNGFYEDVLFCPSLSDLGAAGGPLGHMPIPINEAVEAMIDAVLAQVKEKTGIDITLSDALHFLYCGGIQTLGELWGLEEAVEKAFDGKWDEIDTCTLIVLTRIGICAARRLEGMQFLPDLMEAWLYGNASQSAAWRKEAIALAPSGMIPPAVEVEYYTLPPEPYLEDMSESLFDGLRQVYHEVLEGACKRLQSTKNEIFPAGSGGSGIDLIKGRITFQGEPNRLLDSGQEWIVSQYELKVSSDDHKEVFALGSVVLLSFVDVRAERASHLVANEDGTSEALDGWVVTIESWKLRIWDEADFEKDNPFEVPLPGTSRKLEIPDNVFLRMLEEDCWLLPTPKDFLVMTPTWTVMSVGDFGYKRVFLPDGASCSDIGLEIEGSYHVL